MAYAITDFFQCSNIDQRRGSREMDQTQNLKKQFLSQFIESQLHRKLTQLLVSVSVFSLFFSHSYCLSLLHSFNFNFHDTLPFQLFSHSIDKNCMFLLCNGLVVFLAKYSGLISSSSKYNNFGDDESFKSYEDVPQSESISFEPKPSLMDKEVAFESANKALENSILSERTQEEEAAETERENFILEEKEEDGKELGLKIIDKGVEENAAFVEDHEEELEKGSDNELSVQEFGESENYETEEEEEELVEGNRVLSTEELNKKFDEFIRKMKEELRIEAQQQLVMV